MLKRLGGSYNLDFILEAVRDNEPFIEVDGHLVKIQSKRLQTFAHKGITCVSCNSFASRVFLEQNGNERPHLGVYAHSTRHGGLILMTRDHIVALADGGCDGLINSQPMCCKCNVAKGSMK